ncbi:DMT family transporter [Reinekea sp.]|uniref:DMT family transporter n=1 Tax=Reinekea sp. TaxID=1970455 RepID=UPI003989C945
MNRYFIATIAFAGGALLAAMMAINGYLTNYASPMGASWIAHGTGAIAAFLIVITLRLFSTPSQVTNKASPPWWSFFGGVPGAMVVVLAVILVNSTIGLTGAIVLGIAGQVVFGLFTDQWGWFGMTMRKLNRRRLISSLLILGGSLLILLSKGSMS